MGCWNSNWESKSKSLFKCIQSLLLMWHGCWYQKGYSDFFQKLQMYEGFLQTTSSQVYRKISQKKKTKYPDDRAQTTSPERRSFSTKVCKDVTYRTSWTNKVYKYVQRLRKVHCHQINFGRTCIILYYIIILYIIILGNLLTIDSRLPLCIYNAVLDLFCTLLFAISFVQWELIVSY